MIEKTIKKITEKIASEVNPEVIILFGSAAEGNFREDSDLDICVLGKNTEGLRKISLRGRFIQ